MIATHGHTIGGRPSPTYVSWAAMLTRCTNPNQGKKTRNYRDRGIRVCERWKIFANFLEDMGQRPAGTTLDRIDNNGNYEPGNVRWATRAEQSANQLHLGNPKFLICREGRTQAVATWARELGIWPTAIYGHIRNGVSPERALEIVLARSRRDRTSPRRRALASASSVVRTVTSGT